MKITQKSILSMGSGIVLSCGLTVILILITAPLSSLPVLKNLPYFVFILSLLVIAPVIARSLNRLSGTKKILGWTLIGTGAEFLFVPISFLFVVKLISSPGGILVIGTLFLLSFVIGMLAGLTSIAIGITLIKGNGEKNGRR